MSAPAAAVSPDGKKTAFAWMDKRRDGKDPDVYWTLATGLSISTDGPVSDSTAGDQNHPQLAFSPDGKVVYAVWEDRRSGGGQQIYGTHSALKGKNVVVSGQSRGAYPAIACGGEMVAVVWETDRDTVEFARFPK